MAWVYLDDEFPEHQKNWALTDAAFRLHTSGIAFCNRQLTDGFIRGDKVPSLVPRYRRKTLDELVDRKLWVPIMDGHLYEVHDYLDWNKSKEQITEEKERLRLVRSAAGKKGAEKRWHDK
jgi:hypothetical protein